MEAAGLALNILPLIVSATENYRKLVLTPLCRYQNFADEAGRYVLRLKNQHAIFETKCIHLLAHVTTEERAYAIIDAPYEYASEDMRQIGDRLKLMISKSHNALCCTARNISAVLRVILDFPCRLPVV